MEKSINIENMTVRPMILQGFIVSIEEAEPAPTAEEELAFQKELDMINEIERLAAQES